MSTKIKSNNKAAPEKILKLENALRHKRLAVVDRLAREAWDAGDEDAMIRFRYEWQAIREVIDLPMKELRKRVREGYGDDREWEQMNLWRAAYDAHEYVQQYYEKKAKRNSSDPACA